MTVLGIDPGPKESAFCAWDGERILCAEKSPNQNLRQMLSNGMWPESLVAVEHLQCFGMGVGREVFETAYWIGEFRGLVSYELGRVFIPVTRLEVKTHFCHSARATDSNIRFALEDRFGPKGTKKNPGLMYPLVGSDMRSAFAIAVMVHDKKGAGLSKAGATPPA